MKKYFDNRRGQTLVEFALVLPVFLLLVLGICQFGLMFSSYLTANEVAREGARAAAVGATDTEIKNKVRTMAGSVYNITDANIVINPSPTRTERANVTVSVTMPQPYAVPIVSSFIHHTITANVMMRVENTE